MFGNRLISCALILSVCIPNLIYANQNAKKVDKKRALEMMVVTNCKFRSPQNLVCLAYNFERSAKISIANMLCGRRDGNKL